MKKFFISKNYSDRFTASSKAKIDCEIIVEKLGYKNIGLKRAVISQKKGRIRTVLSNIIAYIRMPRNGIAFLQYPVYGYGRQVLYSKKNKNKIITIIHDIDFLRDTTIEFLEKEYLEQSDVLIVHTDAMKSWCEANITCKHIVVLKLFDYLADDNDEITEDVYNENAISVAFAGNLGKSAFLEKLQSDKIVYNLFGVGINNLNVGKCCIYRGCFPPEELHKHLKSNYGLVWDGVSVDKCSGKGGEYLKYIAPHKTSMYLTCNLPVIVWNQSAIAEYIVNNHLGIAVDSLENLDEILTNISEHEYEDMRNEVRNVQYKLLNGYYLSDAICQAEKYLSK